MTDYLRKYGMKTVENGWPIVLLPHGSKKPIGFKWQQTHVGKADIERILRSEKQYGFGIRCGNIVGIDDDYEPSDVVTDDFLEAVEELKLHYFPRTLWRRGRPSRPPLRVFRLEDNQVAKSRNIDKLQVIGSGRQFVAYNLHPDTQQGYRWLIGDKKGIGSPFSMKLTDVPEYPQESLDGFLSGMQLLEETYGLAPERGKEVLKAIKEGGERPKIGKLWADQRLVEKACDYIVNDEKWGWEDWNNNIMMPLWNASKGEEWGRELAHQVSSPHALYDYDKTDERWDGITKSPPDLLGWPRLNWLARQNGMPFLGPLDWDNYRVFTDRADILEITTPEWWLEKRFTDRFTSYKEKHRTVMATFMESRPDQVYGTVVWNSDLAVGAARFRNRRVWNIWKAPDWFGEPGDVTPWQVLMDKIYGDYSEVIIKRMAVDVQYPELRPQWHVLVIGEHGSGKSNTIMPLLRWADRFDMHQGIQTSMIKDNFNAWLSKKKIITLNEIYGITTAQFDNLKDILAGTEKYISINDKNEKRVNQRIIASFWMSSNHVNAISISKTERRLVIHHSLEPNPQNDPRWKAEAVDIFKWTEKNWPYVIHYLKNDVKVESDFAMVHPGRTNSQLEMAEMTAPVHERIAEHIIELMQPHPVFTMGDIRTAFANSEVDMDLGSITDQILRKSLRHIGAVTLNAGKSVKVINGEGSEQKRFWSLNRGLEKVTNEDIRFLDDTLGYHEDRKANW